MNESETQQVEHSINQTAVAITTLQQEMRNLNGVISILQENAEALIASLPPDHRDKYKYLLKK